MGTLHPYVQSLDREKKRRNVTVVVSFIALVVYAVCNLILKNFVLSFLGGIAYVVIISITSVHHRVFDLFDNRLWRIRVFSFLHLFPPDISGAYKGQITVEETDNKADTRVVEENPVRVEIKQCWTRILIELRTKKTKKPSVSTLAKLDTRRSGERRRGTSRVHVCELHYAFIVPSLEAGTGERFGGSGTQEITFERTDQQNKWKGSGPYYSNKTKGHLHIYQE